VKSNETYYFVFSSHLVYVTLATSRKERFDQNYYYNTVVNMLKAPALKIFSSCFAENACNLFTNAIFASDSVFRET